jgi:hypothetical protein
VHVCANNVYSVTETFTRYCNDRTARPASTEPLSELNWPPVAPSRRLSLEGLGLRNQMCNLLETTKLLIAHTVPALPVHNSGPGGHTMASMISSDILSEEWRT